MGYPYYKSVTKKNQYIDKEAKMPVQTVLFWGLQLEHGLFIGENF